MSRKVYLVMPTGRLSWWIRVMRLIRGSIVHRINHEAQINHVV